MKPYLKYSYKKALRIIDSCNTPAQLIGARNYINNYFRMYSEPGGNVGPFSLVSASTAVADSYNRLLNKIIVKEKAFE